MPLFATLFSGSIGALFSFFTAFMGEKYASRLVAITAIATGYVATVAAFSSFVVPLFSAITATSYGFILGLLFPPIAGTVVAGLMALRVGVLTWRYTTSLLKLAVS